MGIERVRQALGFMKNVSNAFQYASNSIGLFQKKGREKDKKISQQARVSVNGIEIGQI